MSFYQNFDDGFNETRPIRGAPEIRNIPLRAPQIDQDINSRRFDPRGFSDHRNINEMRGNDFRLEQRGPPAPRSLELPRQGESRTIELTHRQGESRALELQHRQGEMRFDSRSSSLIEPRTNDLRTYERQPPQPPARVDPRMNFGLPPSAMGGSSLPPASLLQQAFREPPISQPAPLQPPNLNPLGFNTAPFTSAPALSQFNRTSVTEIIPVHVDLATFASEPKFQQILLKVKEQSGVNYISLNRIADDLVESIVIDAPTKDAAGLARNLIETHLKLQMKIKAAETRLQRVQTDLFSTQGEIAAGQMVEFMIRPELIGLAIGKKGSRIKQIESETGVSSINVSDNGHIMIYGPDSQSVQRAREQLELQEESFPLSNEQMEWMSDKLNASVVLDLKNGSGVMVAKVNRENFKLDVVGTNSSVQTAKFLLSTQLEYIDKQIEIETNEREAREKLNAVRKQYGLNNPQWKNRLAKSGRSRSPEETGRRMVEPVTSHYEVNRSSSASAPLAPPMNKSTAGKGNDVVDSLMRAAMKDNLPPKSAKSNSEQEKEAAHKVEIIPNDIPEKQALPSFDDELDALISDSQLLKKQSEAKANNSRRPKELIMQDTFLGANIKDIDSDKGEALKNNAARGRDRGERERDRERDRGRDKNQNNNANNSIALANNHNNNYNNSSNNPNLNNNNSRSLYNGNSGDSGILNNNNNNNNNKTKGSNNKNIGYNNNNNNNIGGGKDNKANYDQQQGHPQQGNKSGKERQDKQDKTVQSNPSGEKGNNKGKDKPAALKVVNQAATEGSSLVVIPPAPVLVVPPPPAAGSNTSNNNQKKGKKGRANASKDENETKEESAAAAGKEEKKPTKESMLVKLNNPFLEQKGKKPEDAGSSRVVSIIPEAPDSSSSPRRNENQKGGRGGTDRSDSNDLSTAVSSLKLEPDSVSPPKPDDDEEEGGKGSNKRTRRGGKGRNKNQGDKDKEKERGKEESSPSEVQHPVAAISVTDLEKHSPFPDDFEPPLPRPVRKGPPAIPNKVVVVEEPEKKGVVSSEHVESKPQASSTAQPMKIDTNLPHDDALSKKASSPPGLVPPPGLSGFNKTPAATAAPVAATAAPALKPVVEAPISKETQKETSSVLVKEPTSVPAKESSSTAPSATNATSMGNKASPPGAAVSAPAEGARSGDEAKKE